MKLNCTNLDLKLLNISCVLLVLMPLFLVTGPLLSDLSLVFMVSFFFYLILKKKIINLNKLKKFFYFFFLFNLILILSSITSDFLISLKSSLFYFRFYLFAFFIFVLISYNEKLKDNFFYLLLILFLILIFDCYYQYFFKVNITGLKIFADRSSSFFGSELVLGGYLVRFLPLLISMWIYRWSLNKNEKLSFFFIFICLLDLAVILTGERASTILLLIQKFMILIFIPILRKVFLLNIFVFFLTISLFIKSEVDIRIINHTKHYANFNIFDKNFRPYSSEHEELFLTAIKMGQLNLLLGVGPNNFRNLCDEEKYKEKRRFSCSTHPHNFYLQLFAEGGIFSLTILLTLFFFVFRLLFYKFNNVKIFKSNFIIFEFKVILIGIFCNIFPLTTTGNFFNNWLNINIYLPVGFLIYYYFKLKLNKI